MLDIKLIERKTEEVKGNLLKRGFDVDLIDQVLKFNNERRDMVLHLDKLREQTNNLSREIGILKKNQKDAEEVIQKVHKFKKEIDEKRLELASKEEEIESILACIPNLLADDIPTGKDEEDNRELSRWGSPEEFSFKVRDHVSLGENLGMLDFEIAAEMTGSRFVVYKKELARLERAIANFMLDFLMDRDYEEIIPPFIVKDSTLYGTGQLPKFGEDLFKLEGEQNWYLIPTAEVPVTNLGRKKVFNSRDLPLRYASYTPCFRSEAGSYGKDTRGLIRMHQFSKVEMVQITSATESEKSFEEMVSNAAGVLEALQLPYRKILLCSGDIGFGARKTIDLEVWVPSQKKYREISSVSNCWDFQARRAQIRYKENGQGAPVFAHTLNGSCLAVGRTLVAVMENYQQEDGSIKIPSALQPYMRNEKEISFSTEQKN